MSPDLAAVIVMLATCLLGAWLLGHRRRRGHSLNQLDNRHRRTR